MNFISEGKEVLGIGTMNNESPGYVMFIYNHESDKT